jgi:phosphoribosyl 1,2-cyclic phosphodiesterase
MIVQSLCSGSSGNCLFVQQGDDAVLVDAGLSADSAAERLAAHGRTLESLSGIVLTHLHGDHYGCAGRISRRKKVAVYCSADAAASNAVVGRLKRLERFAPGDRLQFGKLAIHTIAISHDAPGTVACTIEGGGARFGIATDCGRAPRAVAEAFRACDGFLLEFNHRESALRDGPYPWRLKRRVLSDEGHLSNEQSAAMLRDCVGPRTRTVLLGHLSEHNNHPDWALDAARHALAQMGRSDVTVCVAPRGAPGPVLEL